LGLVGAGSAQAAKRSVSAAIGYRNFKGTPDISFSPGLHS
jgi:hypothetical protein